jgi:hypothetical protein
MTHEHSLYLAATGKSRSIPPAKPRGRAVVRLYTTAREGGVGALPFRFGTARAAASLLPGVRDVHRAPTRSPRRRILRSLVS